jgi:hypothetical protein
VEELLAERGISVENVAIYRRVQTFTASASACTPLASLLAQAERLLPNAVRDARD